MSESREFIKNKNKKKTKKQNKIKLKNKLLYAKRDERNDFVDENLLLAVCNYELRNL